MPLTIAAVFAYRANTVAICHGQSVFPNEFEDYFISFSPFLLFKVSYSSGVAINNEEYVPTIIPISRAKVNPLITSPPNRNIIRITRNVVKDVLNVLLKVLFSDLFIVS
jgi:hypothetical protein